MIYPSLILPIKNEELHIESTLGQLVAQEYPLDRYEILVIDGMSNNYTRHVVTTFITNHDAVNIRMIDNPGLWPSRAQTFGVRESQGQLIAIIDGHIKIPSLRLHADMEDIRKNQGTLCLSRPAPLVIPGAEKNTGFWIAVARRT